MTKTVTVTISGEMIAWGNNRYGQCNVPADAQSGVTWIAGGGFHSLALKTGEGVSPSPSPVIGPVIKANGSTNDISIYRGANLSITVQIDPGEFAGTPVDWWVVVCSGSSWFYLDSEVGWTQEGAWRPVYQGVLGNLPATVVLNITDLQTGLYTFFFVVDLPMDGILKLEQIWFDSVKVNVQ